MKTDKKNIKAKTSFRQSAIRKFISRLDKKMEEIINFFVSQIEDTYQN